MRKTYIRRTGKSVPGRFTSNRVYEAYARGMYTGRREFEVVCDNGHNMVVREGDFFAETTKLVWDAQEMGYMQSILNYEVKPGPAALAAIKSIKEEIMNQAIPSAPYPQAIPPASYGVPKTAEQIVQDAQQALADAEAALAAKQERDAFRDALEDQIKSVGLVAMLLSDIMSVVVYKSKPYPRPEYAVHRKMLNEYAEEHGYKLVLVGDKTEAVLVQA